MKRLTDEQRAEIYDATGLPPHMIEAIEYAVTPMLAEAWDDGQQAPDALTRNPYRDA